MKPSIKIMAMAVVIFAICGQTAFSEDSVRKKSDGILQLHGTVQEVRTNDQVLRFVFTGKLTFDFYAAPTADSAGKRVSLNFDIQKVPVSIPKFGTSEFDQDDSYWRQSYKNAVLHSLDASQSGESVRISLYAPKLSWGANHMMDQIEGRNALIQSDRRLRQLRGERQP